jgi:uncharacterized protein YjiS (DUF1127 family)
MSTMLKTAPLGPARQALGSPSHWQETARRIVLLPLRLLILWQNRLRDRAVLQQMTEVQLKDIGISRADALGEAEKPFWRR